MSSGSTCHLRYPGPEGTAKPSPGVPSWSPQAHGSESGTSGFRPKGLTYDQAGYMAGAMLTMETSFDVRAGSRPYRS